LQLTRQLRSLIDSHNSTGKRISTGKGIELRFHYPISTGKGKTTLVRAALPFIADKGSFTLVSGVLTDEYTYGGSIGTTINHLVEGFVKGAAAELPRGLRINCVSPMVLTESVAYHAYFPGFVPVSAWEVGQAYLRAISTPITGRVLNHKTNC
jgi:NAD(P)-dependent dehydrogenase (short-subunit alcohol dehydrogenase family)